MSTRHWQGGAAAVAQVTSWVFAGTWTAADTITVAIGSKTYTVTTGSSVIATLIGTLQAALAALSSTVYPEYAEITWTDDATHLIGTAVTAGKPFTVTVSTNSALGTIGGSSSSTGSNTTASSGPNDWGTALNWSGGAVPVSTDDVVVDDPTWAILYGLAQSGVTLNSLTVTGRFNGTDETGGTIGLPFINADSTEYFEYRATYLQIGATNVYLGQGTGGGSGRIKHDAGSVATNWYVYSSGSSPDSGLNGIMLKGTSASNVLNVTGSSDVGVAVVGGETANLSGGLTVGPGANVRCGSGVTLATVTNNGGTLETNSAIATSLTHTNSGASTTINGTGAVAQLTLDGGTCTYNTSGTLGGNTVVGNDGYLDFTQDQRAKTVTNVISLYGTASGGSDAYKVVSSLVLDFYYGASPAQWNWGVQAKLTRATPP